MKKSILMCAVGLTILASCEKPIIDDVDGGSAKKGNVTLTFTATTADAATTRTVSTSLQDYFQKLSVMLFDAKGNRAFDKVKTQTADDGDFGQLSIDIAEGTYTVVAVGHSSAVTPTIKSPATVQFTAQNGRKLTDTFCYCGTISVTAEPEQHALTMTRASAMFRLDIQDGMPDDVAQMKFDYTGGSANFNPTTLEGTTKSTQSEVRGADEMLCVYTFPYQSDTGKLKMTVSALSVSGVVIAQREFTDVPMTRNRITTYSGDFFGDGTGEISQSSFGFTVNGAWDGEDTYQF